jgi:hypothetical protein
MIASAQISPSEKILIGGITYTIAVNENNRVTFIQSQDPRFKTPEGLSVESTLADVLAAGGRPVLYETGWAQYSELPSGWCAAFYGPLPDLFRPPTANSKVAHFFKR